MVKFKARCFSLECGLAPEMFGIGLLGFEVDHLIGVSGVKAAFLTGLLITLLSASDRR